jgi:hypothetical protein
MSETFPLEPACPVRRRIMEKGKKWKSTNMKDNEKNMNEE